jgi:signal recognition particle receptor subunit beta
MNILFSILSLAIVSDGHRRTHHAFRTPRHHRKNPFSNMVHEIAIHTPKLDLEQYKPPKELHIMEDQMKEIQSIEAKETDELRAEEDVIKKVETDYLASDLHKEAVEMKLMKLPYDA